MLMTSRNAGSLTSESATLSCRLPDGTECAAFFPRNLELHLNYIINKAKHLRLSCILSPVIWILG